MIYTVTFNPALDYIMEMDTINTGLVNRSLREAYLPGGKGINVSIVLNELGEKNTALGFVGGFTGEEFLRLLKQRNIDADFINISGGATRINVKIKEKQETEINASGPKISEDDIKALTQKLKNISDGDYLILSGSVPKSCGDGVYAKIMENLKNVRVVVDATGALLMNTLKHRPFLIKPNICELEEVAKRKLINDADIKAEAKKLLDMGAENVLISMGKDGAVFVNQTVYLKLAAPSGEVINTTGSGDSMVAGFIAGFIKTGDYCKAVKTAIASGSATAFSYDIADREKIDEVLKSLE